MIFFSPSKNGTRTHHCDVAKIRNHLTAEARGRSSSCLFKSADVMQRVVEISRNRREEIIDWLIREAGSTRVKAELEWQIHCAVTVEAASFPFRVEGRILPAREEGKENRAYRQPLGVIGVISPWNFPLHLSHRSVGPALALGDGRP